MEYNNNMGRFFDWLAKPMNDEDINAWYLANNITLEHTELFRDFCLSFLNLFRFELLYISYYYGNSNVYLYFQILVLILQL